MRFLGIRLKLHLFSPKKKDSLSFEKFFAISWCLSVLLPSPFRDTRFPFLVSCAAPSIFPLPPFVLFVTAHSTPLAFLPLGLPFNLTLSLLLAPAISRFISLLFIHLLLLSLSFSPRLGKSFSSRIDVENLILFLTANVWKYHDETS